MSPQPTPPTDRTRGLFGPRRARRLGMLLATLVLASLAPAPVGAREPVPTSGEVRSTAQYEDAIRHAHDRIPFTSGARVSVPFTPRRGDRWTVDGGPPRSLPAGRSTGRTMRQAPPDASTSFGSAATETGAASLPDDRPIVDPASVIAADGATWDTADSPSFQLAAAVDPGALKREVFGFLPYWELSDGSTRLDWEKISTLAYFGVGADGAGNLQTRNADGSTTVGWSGWTSSKMTDAIDAAHRSGARVVLTVQSFAWSSTGLKRQKALLGSPSARARLAAQIVAAVRDRGADGVNLDFEPIASGYADEFTALVRTVRAAFKAVARGYQVTFDATGWIGNYPVADATASGGADAVVIMGYDYRSSGSNPVGSIAPIGGPSYDITDTLRAYLGLVPASKVILGVPYYGRAWSTSSDRLHAKNISGTKYGPSTTAVYGSAQDLATTNGKRYDPAEGVAWTAYKRQTCSKAYGCVTSWRQLYFDDAKALKAKYDLVNRYALRGIGIWALGYDGTRPELYAAIKAKFITDTVPPVITGTSLSSPVFSPNGDGRLDATTASLNATGLVTWGYRVARFATGPTTAVRSGSKPGRAPVFTWDGTDADGKRVPDGAYEITLWAADVSGNRSLRRFRVVVDTRPATIASKAAPGFVTPDGDRHADTLPLAWTSTEPLTGAAGLRDAAGGTVRRWTFSARGSWSATWDGTDGHGAVVPDGRYVFRVDGRDPAGNRTVLDRPVIVDRTIRSVRWSAAAFDPRAKATDRVFVTLRRSARVTMSIYRGSVLIRRIWADRAITPGVHGWTWDGRTDARAYAAPGAYRVIVTATSRIGTTRFSRSVTVARH